MRTEGLNWRTGAGVAVGVVAFVPGIGDAIKGAVKPILGKQVSGLEIRGFKAPPGTRQIPQGIPDSWKIRPTKGEGGVWYYDPTNKGNAVRVMPGNPASSFPNSQSPYVRWQSGGHSLDASGNPLQTKFSPEAHIPLQDFKFNLEPFK